MKKKFLSLTLGLLGLISTPLMAYDSIFDITCWYLRGSGSVDWHRNVSFTTSTYNAEADANTGWDVGGSFGIILDQWRAEAEVYYRDSDFNNISSGGVTSGGGSITDLAVMGNLYFDIPIHECFKIYIGAGAGVDFNSFELNTFTVTELGVPGPTNKVDEDDVTFAWQVLAGIIYALTEQFDIYTGYRWFAHTKPDGFTISAPTIGSVRSATIDNFQYSHNVEAGIRFRF